MRFARKWIALLLALAMLFAMTGYSEEAAQLEPVAEEAEEIAEEIFEEEPIEEPEEGPAEEPAESPAESIEAPAEEPAEGPAEESAEEPAEAPAEEPVEEPAEAPIEEPAEAPEEESAESLEPAEPDAFAKSAKAGDVKKILKDIQLPVQAFDAAESDDMLATNKNHQHTWNLIKEGEPEATYKQLSGTDAYYQHKVNLQQSKKYECTVCHAVKDTVLMMTFEEPHGIVNSRCIFCNQIPAYSYSPKHTKHSWSVLIPFATMEQAGFVNETEYADKDASGHTRIKTEFIGLACSGCDSVSVAATVYTERRTHDFAKSGNVRTCRDCGYSEIIPNKIILSAKKMTLGVGETAELSVKEILPVGAHANVTFKSSNSKIAIEQNPSEGDSVQLRAMAKGSATITARTDNGKTAKCKVTIKKAPTSATLSANAMDLGVGESAKLKVTLAPKGCAGSAEWSSSDEDVVSVSNGEIRAISEGSATITAKIYNLPELICEVTVHPAPTAENAKLTPEGASVKVKKKLQLSVAYDGAAGAVKSWKSSSKKIATVSKTGVVKGVKKGTATITATLYNGVKITTVVSVTK